MSNIEQGISNDEVEIATAPLGLAMTPKQAWGLTIKATPANKWLG